jgi:hypothetical protein
MSQPEYQNDQKSSRLSGDLDTGQRGSGIPLETPATVQQSATPEVVLIDLDEEYWARCSNLAQERLILARLANELKRSGLAGESRAAMVTYLALTSRLLEEPVSLAIKGPSSAGKSNVVEQVLKFFPPESYYVLTAMSEKTLAYSSEPLSHRFLVVYEAAGLQSDFANYLLRSLLSEGRLRYETVVKTEAGFRTQVFEREGPTGLITTTTRIRMHCENETRYLSVPVDDSRNQTHRILMAIAKDRREAPDCECWQALQRWLASGERRVFIPYAEVLAELIPPVAVRLRRDFSTVLNLIRAHALLHRATRERDGEGRIVATIKDYFVVHKLVAGLISDGVDAAVSTTIRETVAAVAKLTTTQGDEATLRQVADELDLDKSAASRRVRAALDRGYLKNSEFIKERSLRLVLGDPLPGDTELLPDPETLEQKCCSVAVKSGG